MVNRSEVCPKYYENWPVLVDPLTFETLVDNWPEAQRVFQLVLFVLMVLYFVACLGLFYERKNTPHLYKREFTLICLCAVGGVMQGVNVSLRDYIGREQYPCDTYLFLTMLTLPVGVGPVLVRAILFANKKMYSRMLATVSDGRLHNYEVLAFSMAQNDPRKYSKNPDGIEEEDAADLAEAAEGSMGNSITTVTTQGGYIGEAKLRRAAFLASWRFGIAIMFAFLAFMVAITLGIYFLDDSYGNGCVGCTLADSLLAFVIIIAIFLVGYCLFALWRIRKEPDPLGIIRELQVALSLGFILFLPAAAFSTIDPGNVNDDGVFNWGTLNVIAFIVVFTVQCPLQIYVGYLRKNQKRDSTGMEDILNDPKGRIFFETHLANEFALENLYFFRQCTAYKENFDNRSQALNNKAARRLVRLYIARRAPFELNLSGDVRGSLLEFANSDNPQYAKDTFDEVLEEVYQLMKRDSYHRFKQSRLFRVYKGEEEPRPEDDLPNMLGEDELA